VVIGKAVGNAVSDLVAFLTARLDEDEKAAKSELARQWYASLPGKYESGTGPFDPARVLREVEAKRRILELHGQWGSRFKCVSLCDNAGYPCGTVRALAAVYAGHPDYDPEWA